MDAEELFQLITAVHTVARAIKAYLCAQALTTAWTNTLFATLKSIMKHQKSFHLSITMPLEKTSFLLGLKTRNLYFVFLLIRTVLADKIFSGFLSKTNGAVIVIVIILV